VGRLAVGGGKDLPVLRLASGGAWESWLTQHHATSRGVWLTIAKKGSAKPGLSYEEALDTALCFGWIDGQKDRLDHNHWLQRFTPRAARSKWSRINRDRAVKLIELGRMQEAGRTQVEQAKADGRWDAAYEGQRVATVPDDLQRALAADREAQEFFSRLDGRNRYAILYRIQGAKTPETRGRLVEKYVAMLREGRTIHK
jgi:uncharacterized protein YdeI (YjbR/CyaY-like superfamily)